MVLGVGIISYYLTFGFKFQSRYIFLSYSASHIVCTSDLMAIHHLRYAALMTALATSITAQISQRPTIVPTDLQAGFLANGDTVQVSFTNE